MRVTIYDLRVNAARQPQPNRAKRLECAELAPAPCCALRVPYSVPAAGIRDTPHATRNTQHGTRNTEHGTRFNVLTLQRFNVSTFQRFNAHHAFSLVEILVTVGILSFIIIGLLAMFNQTQRAFRNGMTQSDILESGRAVSEMMHRELEQMTPSQLPFTTNFMAEVALPTRLANGFTPQYFPQELPGDNTQPQLRTNIFEHFFFLTHENLTWTGIGYLVDTPANGFGSLYRFQAQTANTLYPDQVRTLASNFNFAAWALYSQNAFLTNYLQNTNPLAPTLTRVADGVVDLRIRPYSPSGYPLNTTNYLLNGTISNQRIPFPLKSTEQDCFFWSNAVPAYLELEIGFMEDRTFARLKAMPSVANAQSNYLRAHSANVHLFRQRVAVRNTDLTAYPYP